MGINCCIRTDDTFPKLLKDIKQSPEKLYYTGDISIINSFPCVAIIGSRDASPHALDMAFNMGRIAAENGFAVVNGLAIGCDGRAFNGALSVGGKCVAVMPCGLDEVYPKSNKKLADEILENGGCMISEYPSGTKPQRYTFVQRDRLQSGISKGVIVIETTENGGTMHTVKFAEQQMRRLACYYSTLSKMASGNELIIKKGMGQPVNDEKSIVDFLVDLNNIKHEQYEQLSFF